MTKTAIKTNILLGALLMFMAQFFSASVVTAVKVVSLHVPTLITIFTSYLICLILVTVILLCKKGYGVKTQHVGLQIARSLSGILYFGGLFWAVKYIPVVDGVLLRSTAPIWVPFIAFLWSREKFDHRIWAGTALGFLGIILVLHPTLVSINIGYFIALIAAVSFALSSIITHRLNALGEPLIRTLFYTFLLPSIVLAPYAILYWPKGLSIEDFSLLIFIGVGTLVLLFFYISALRYASATILLPITYIGVVIAGLYGWILWRHIPNTISIIGMILVFLGCFFIIWIKNKKSK